MKKQKEEKIIDYSRVPVEQFAKELNDLMSTMDDIGRRLEVLERSLNRLTKSAQTPPT